MKAVESVNKNGFKPSKGNTQRVAVVDGSSQSLLISGQLEFPVSLDTGYFNNVKAVTLEEALTNKDTYDYALVFSTNTAKTERRIQTREKQSSKFVSGERELPNPAYEQARMSVHQAQTQAVSASSQYCRGWGCLGKAIVEAAAASKLQKAQGQLSSTPMMLKEDTYTEYNYSKSSVKARKHVSTNYYLLDLRNNKILRGSFDIDEARDFTIAYRVNEKDISYDSIINNHDSEEDVSNFEKSDITISLGNLIEQIYKNKGMFKTFKPSYESLKKIVLADRHEAIKNYKLASDEVLPVDDKRMEHVVVIHSPTGSIGTGFYVKPDIVLTNYHVVEGAEFMEIKTHDGAETFGKVVKSDVRLDLALIKVQQRGKPVKFYSGSIPLGSTVEAIGHPKGLEYSITRGVVSAIRKRENVYGIGGKKVTFIQTDTPINSGNSGGPMFLENKVIGVNNNKRVDKNVEGLAFSIHFSEVNDFMRKDF